MFIFKHSFDVYVSAMDIYVAFLLFWILHDLLTFYIFRCVGKINWILKENPAIFGTDIHLVCHLPNTTTCCNDYRKWNAGYQHILIIVNGLSHNTSKYKEDLIVKDKVSVLTIFSFNEKDVNIPYICVYGFDVYPSVLLLNEHVFECKYRSILFYLFTILLHVS